MPINTEVTPGDPSGAPLPELLGLLERALVLCDQAGLPANVGARLDEIIQIVRNV